jgi:hypothetical protein
LSGINTQAYYDRKLITFVKSLVVLAPGDI